MLATKAAMCNGDHAVAVCLMSELLCHPFGLEESWTESGDTLLDEACRWQSLPVINLLLDHGALVNCTRRDTLSPLHLASMSGYIDVMSILLLWAADPNMRDAGGYTPLQKALLTAPSAQVAEARELLQSMGAWETEDDWHAWVFRLAKDRLEKAYVASFFHQWHMCPDEGLPASSFQ
jgi:ankyrin repeat protein